MELINNIIEMFLQNRLDRKRDETGFDTPEIDAIRDKFEKNFSTGENHIQLSNELSDLAWTCERQGYVVGFEDAVQLMKALLIK